MSSRYEKHTPVIQLDEITSSEEAALAQLVALANSPTGQFIRKVAGSFVNATLAETITLGGLSDVTITGPAIGDLLVFDGSNYVNLATSIANRVLTSNGVGSPLSWTSVGTGTVTTVSVVTANGVSATVADAGSTPALTFTLGAITPSSVVSTGVLTGTLITGSNLTVNTTTIPAEGIYRPTGAGNLGFSVSGAAELLLTATVFSPAVSDGNALGSGTLMWGDLFLASGAVISFNNGDVVITHSADTLAFTGAATGYTFDKIPTVSSIPVGIRPATFVVAASDSLDKTRADYVCDGTNDEVEINQAIAALPSGGGKVILLEGTYQMGGTAGVSGNGNSMSVKVVDGKHHVVLEGMGQGTILFCKAATDTQAIDISIAASVTDTTIRNLTIDGNKANMGVLDPHGIYIEAYANRVWIENVYIHDTGGANLYTDIPQDVTVINCYFINSNNSWGNWEGGGPGSTAINNLLYGGAGCYAGLAIYGNDSMVRLIGNYIDGVQGTGGTDGRGIENWNDFGTIIGNEIYNVKKQGIIMLKANHNTVTGNTIRNASTQTNNTYDAIHLESQSGITTKYNVISNNVILSTNANKHRYGISELATNGACNPNIFTNNVILNSVTAATLIIVGGTTDVSHNITA